MSSCTAVDVEALQERVIRARRDGRVPSLVAAVLRDGEVAWSTGAGQVDGGTGPTPTVDTSYRIGSITKSLVATVVHQVAAEGRVALDDPVGTYADIPAAVAELRLGELLGHGSGLRAETSGPWWERTPGRSRDELWADLATVDCARPAPRGVLHYSNVGYALLGRVIEEVDGRSWFDALRERVLEPAGMDHTVLSLPGLDAARAADGDPVAWSGLDAAVPLAVHSDRAEVLVEPVHDYGVMAPAGQLWSTAADMARWAQVLAGHAAGVVPSGVLDAMRRPRLVDVLSTGTAFGSGLQVRAHDDLVLVGHGGSVPGFVATVLVAPAVGVGSVVLANSTAGFDPGLGTDLLDLARGFVPDGAAAADDPGRRDATDRGAPAEAGADVDDGEGGWGGEDAEVVGEWFWGPRSVTVRTGVSGGLVLDLGSGARRSRLARVAPGRWRGRDAYFDGEEVQAVRDADGAVTHLDVASFVLTRRPYDPPAVVPGGIGHGWRPAPALALAPRTTGHRPRR